MLDPDSGDLLLVAAGDEAAFFRLLSRWRAPVYALFERTREPSAAMEAAIDVFLELRRAAGRYAPATAFPVFLFALVARTIAEEPADTPLSVPAARLADSASARTALVRSAAAALPAPERSAFLLTRVARLSLADAARACGTSEGELKKRVVRAMEALRRTLGPVLESAADGGAEGERTTTAPVEGGAS